MERLYLWRKEHHELTSRVKRRPMSPPRRRRVKRGAPNLTGGNEAKQKLSGQNLTRAIANISTLVHWLEMQAWDADLKTRRRAFEALTGVLHDVFAWLHTSALLPYASLGGLVRQLPGQDTWSPYNRGEHVTAWAGVELARFYKQMKADLGSRSKHSANRLRDLRFGYKRIEFRVPPNPWFREEYERRTDYRPSGKMAIWVARKIEEMRRLKAWRDYATIELVGDRLQLVRPYSETEAVLPDCLRSNLVRGEAVKTLDSLPPFGDPSPHSFEAWRKFLRHRVLTNAEILSDFDIGNRCFCRVTPRRNYQTQMGRFGF